MLQQLSCQTDKSEVKEQEVTSNQRGFSLQWHGLEEENDEKLGEKWQQQTSQEYHGAIEMTAPEGFADEAEAVAELHK